MEKLRKPSNRGFRAIVSSLRKIAKDTTAPPSIRLRATEWLLYMECGAPERPVNPKDLRPVRVEEIDPNAPISDPSITADEGDAELQGLIKKLRS